MSAQKAKRDAEDTYKRVYNSGRFYNDLSNREEYLFIESKKLLQDAQMIYQDENGNNLDLCRGRTFIG